MRLREDRGSAVAEFTLVAGLLSLIFAAVLQIGFAVHVRNTVIDSALSGARTAGLADQDGAAGRDTARELLSVSLGEAYARDITVDAPGPGRIVTVTVRVPVPLIGPVGPRLWEISARSLAEDPQEGRR